MMQPNYFQQQQIPVVNGMQGVNNLKLAPNSSILLADATDPIVYRCSSDSIGNITTMAYDITPHKTEEQIKQDRIEAMLTNISNRLEKLENESITKRNEQNDTQYYSGQTSLANITAIEQSESLT